MLNIIHEPYVQYVIDLDMEREREKLEIDKGNVQST